MHFFCLEVDYVTVSSFRTLYNLIHCCYVFPYQILLSFPVRLVVLPYQLKIFAYVRFYHTLTNLPYTSLIPGFRLLLISHHRYPPRHICLTRPYATTSSGNLSPLPHCRLACVYFHNLAFILRHNQTLSLSFPSSTFLSSLPYLSLLPFPTFSSFPSSLTTSFIS